MKCSNECHVKIVGVSGYSGGELIRLLLNHPQVKLTALTAFSLTEPTPLHTYFPRLRGECDLLVEKEVPGEAGDADVVFLCTPHGESMRIVPEYRDKQCTIIDLSADFRFVDPSEREGYYAAPHPSAEACAEAVYGMPELFRDRVKGAKLIANPGCYPTGIILALYPAIREEMIETEGIHISAASGVTGAGKKPKAHLHHPELDQNFYPYRIGNHQHTPEILSVLRRATGTAVSATFVPHLLPLQRGILSTIFCKRSKDISLEAIWKQYNSIYQNEPFIRLYPLGEQPTLQAVRESNYVDISIHEDKKNGALILVSAVDNLMKGAAGQAVQNMNLIMGYPEGMGLLNQHR